MNNTTPSLVPQTTLCLHFKAASGTLLDGPYHLTPPTTSLSAQACWQDPRAFSLASFLRAGHLVFLAISSVSPGLVQASLAFSSGVRQYVFLKRGHQELCVVAGMWDFRCHDYHQRRLPDGKMLIVSRETQNLSLGWRDNAMVNGMYCSFREPKPSSQHPRPNTHLQREAVPPASQAPALRIYTHTETLPVMTN